MTTHITRRNFLGRIGNGVGATASTLAAVKTTSIIGLLSHSRRASAQGFDHRYTKLNALMKAHVQVLGKGEASAVRYAALSQQRPALEAALSELAAVGEQQFQGFDRAQQMAFLINAYNAYTLELILTRYPRLESIKDLGTLLQGPWKPKVYPLLGRRVSLDEIEHEMLRAPGRYDDPRIHFAVNCASIGCPSLREEAYTADRLEAQLEEQTRRFLSDRSRNRVNVSESRLEVSKIFDWYGKDFTRGWRGTQSVQAFCKLYAGAMASTPAERELLASGTARLRFLDYDWRLNDARA